MADPLSSVFRDIAVREMAVDWLEAYAPWGFLSDDAVDVRFIVILNGHATLTRPGEEPTELYQGDTFFQIGKANFAVADSRRTRPKACSYLLLTRTGSKMRIDGSGSRTVLLAGRFNLDRSDYERLHLALPPAFYIRQDAVRTDSVKSLLEMVQAEADRPEEGSTTIVSLICQMLLIHTARAFYAAEGEAPALLEAMRDQRLLRLLKAVHEDLHRKWTVETMATLAGMSRSSFADLFKRTVGQSPIEYLSACRLRVAASQLRHGSSTVTATAREAGYASESAFTKAFKRSHGVRPSVLRKGW